MNALSGLVEQLRPYAEQLVQVAADNGLAPRVTSTYRTYAEQKALYDKWLSGASAYPASPPGEGSHELGWAFDLVVNPMEYLAPLGELWEDWGGTWGGRWRHPDVIHFELPQASQIARQLAAAGQFPGPRQSPYGFSVWDLLEGRTGLGRSKLWDWAQQQAGIR